MHSDRLSLPDAEVSYFRNVFPPETCAHYLQQLQSEIAWRQESIKLFSKEIPQPRLTAWYGDAGAIYTYSNLTNHPLPWTPTLREIKAHCEEIAQTQFNSVLLNYYRDGQDSMGWHQDNEPELGAQPVIASVSFGATRRFQFRHKQRKDLEVVTIELEAGSLLLMQGATQTYWKHQLPKTAQSIGARINLTFRVVYSRQVSI